jgi:hypothetical protein
MTSSTGETGCILKDGARPDNDTHDVLVLLEAVVAELIASDAHGPHAASAD